MRNTRNLRILTTPESETVGVIGKCLGCKEAVIFPPIPKEDWKKFLSGEGLMRNIFPYLDPNLREFLISRICDTCFDKITKEDEG